MRADFLTHPLTVDCYLQGADGASMRISYDSEIISPFLMNCIVDVLDHIVWQLYNVLSPLAALLEARP